MIYETNEEERTDYMSLDERWRRSGIYHNESMLWRKMFADIQRQRKQKWLKERVQCVYCDWYYWPDEIEGHIMRCSERYL